MAYRKTNPSITQRQLASLLLGACLLAPLFSEAGGPPPPSLAEIAGLKQESAHLKDAALVIIDAQREYLDGHLPLAGMASSVKEAARLLARARQAGTPVIHVVHKGKGALFNPDSPYFQIVPSLRPLPGERVVEKTKVSAFADTDLDAVLASTGKKKLILAGYMTHHCLSTTARAALDRGYAVTIVADATATRDLPDGRGGTIPAATVQAANLAALADRTAVVVKHPQDIPE